MERRNGSRREYFCVLAGKYETGEVGMQRASRAESQRRRRGAIWGVGMVKEVLQGVETEGRR